MLVEILADIAVGFTRTSVVVPCSFGKNVVQQNAMPPRIVWVPTKDDWADPVQLGQQYRSIRTRLASVAAHIWGVSYAQCEAILHNLIRILDERIGGPNYRIGAAEWLEGDTAELGVLVILPMSFMVPVLSRVVTIPADQTTPVSPPAAASEVTVVASNPAANQVSPDIHTYDKTR